MAIINREHRNTKIFLRFLSGEKERRLNKEFGLTVQHVRKIIKNFANDLKRKEPLLFLEIEGEVNIPNYNLLTEQQIFKNSQKIESRPRQIGIYFLFNGNRIVYVGQSKSVYSRIGSHQEDNRIKFDRFAIISCEKTELNILEVFYIRKFNPIHNKQRGFRSNIIGILKDVRVRSQLLLKSADKDSLNNKRL